MMLGIGLHVLVAVFFAVHAIRSRQQMIWLMILFMFPLLGSGDNASITLALVVAVCADARAEGVRGGGGWCCMWARWVRTLPARPTTTTTCATSTRCAGR